MEVGEVSRAVEFLHIELKLVYSVCSIDKKWNALLFKKILKGLNGTDHSRSGDDVIEHCESNLLWVAVHEILHC